jgi:phosphate acetyltransferase/phosphate butyryltransferase
MSGDTNPQHIDAEFAASTRFHGVIAHGMWGAALISAVLNTACQARHRLRRPNAEVP